MLKTLNVRNFNWKRLALVACVGLVSGYVSWRTHPAIDRQPLSDFSVLYTSARAWVDGENPYASVGPGRAHPAPHGVFYPFTAVLASVPFVFVPNPDAFYTASGAALFAWAVSSHPRFRFAWFAILTPAFIYTVRMSQWSTFVVAGALLPWWGFLLACKPTVGTALWLAFPSRRSLFVGGTFVAISLVALPIWPAAWLSELATPTHIRAPLTFLGGPLLLLAWLRWRRPEARLLGALACIPHTPELYESLALFLVPSTAAQGLTLAVLNYGVVIARGPAPPNADYVADMLLTGQWMVWLLYLPCLVMVLSRPNVWPDPAMLSGAGDSRDQSADSPQPIADASVSDALD